MKNLSLLILCAGFGKRMLNLTRDNPKPLLKINNITLLSNTIKFFQDLGFDNIFINTHYLHHKIQSYLNEKFYQSNITLIYETKILGTGGGVKNIFNYLKKENLCVVNSDIFWKKSNKSDIFNFLKDFDDVTHCKILLSKNKDFLGLKKTNGDFNIQNNIISNWNDGKEILFYSGFQIVSKKIFKNRPKIFSMNHVWNDLILNKTLKGELLQSQILHIGDKNSFDKL